MATVILGPSRIVVPTPPGGLTLTSTKVNLTLTSTVSGLHPFAFGHPFKRGDVPAAMGSDLSTGVQFSVLNRWSDGSVKFGIIAGRANLTAGTPKLVALGPGTMPSPAPLAIGDLQSAMNAAPKPVATAELVTWGVASLETCVSDPSLYLVEQTISGPEMSEWIFEQKIYDAALHVRFYVRLFVGGRLAIRPAFGNGYVNSGPECGQHLGRVIVIVGGVTVYDSVSQVTIYHHQKIPIPQANCDWHWIGGDPHITPKHDMAYCKATKLFPNLIATSVTDTALNSFQQTWGFQNISNLPGNQWGGGGDFLNNYVGFFPGWDACYVASGADSRAYRAILVNGYAYGIYSFHDPDPNTRQPFALNTWPNANRPPRYGNEQYYSAQYDLEWDVSHGPPCGYIPYLVTGDRYFLEELQFQVNWTYLAWTNAFGQGVNRRFDGGQVRSLGFHLWRNLPLAIGITPDAHHTLQPWNDWVVYWGNGVNYWANRPLPQKLPLGWFTDEHQSQSLAFQWFTGEPGFNSGWPKTPGGFLGNPYTHCFGHYFVGMTKDLEIDSFLTSAQQTDFNNFLAYALGISTGWFGDDTSGKFNYRFAGVHDMLYATDDRWPLDGTTAHATHGAAFDYWFGQTNSPSLPVPAGGNATTIMKLGTNERSLATWGRQTRFDDPNQEPNYFPEMMCALAQAVDQGIPGANDAWWRITQAENWQLCIGTLPAGPKLGIGPRVPVTQPITGGGYDPGTGIWTPSRDPSGYVTNWNGIPPNQWVPVANSVPVTAFTALLNTMGYAFQQGGETEILDGYCGVAQDRDPVDPQAYAFGGGHDAGRVNAMMQFSIRKIQWTMKDPATNPIYYPPGYTINHGNFGIIYYPSDSSRQRMKDFFDPAETTPGDNRRAATHTYQGSVIANGVWHTGRATAGTSFTEFNLTTNQYTHHQWGPEDANVCGSEYGLMAFDAPSQTLHYHAFQYAYLGHRSVWDWPTRTILLHLTPTYWPPAGGWAQVPAHRKAYYIARSTDGTEYFTILRWQDFAAGGALGSMALTGEYPAAHGGGYYSEFNDMSSMFWHPTLGRLIFANNRQMANGVVDKDVYEVDPSNGACVRRVLTGSLPSRPGNNTGMYDRFFQVPGTTVWLVMPHSQSNIYALNLP